MRPVRGMRLVGVLAVGGLVLAAAGCGKPPAKNNGANGAASASGKPAHGCMVTDTGGINDRSFNASAWTGMQAAASKNSNIKVDYVQSSSEADYQPNLTQFVNQKCDLIVAIGGLMGDATSAAAKANPDQKFAIVDDSLPLANVYSIQFDTAQAGYLAGYLAAGYSKSKTVATYGGVKIPPVTIFMDGFVQGVQHYNEVKKANVKVLGWNSASQNGSFTNDFTDQNKGRSLSDAFVAQGADVIMPVAGGAGLGTAAAAQQSGGKYSVIWVDQDGCVSAAQYCSVFLSTVVKNVSDATQAALASTSAGSLQGGTGSIGTLANNGVQLAPYHDFDSKVPAELKTEIDKLKQDIISGTVKVTSPAEPVPPAVGSDTSSVAPSASAVPSASSSVVPSPSAS
ncbi:BMP family ABC transporter substrate-binding protein [Rugosimonospora acidiphila]|uniref:BMP family ABC transporter substrate-binding protein n=1 Tax=Rugosimonospora acidiphila TaxID=556531 RepID=A0ABP9SC87_9ACTN